MKSSRIFWEMILAYGKYLPDWVLASCKGHCSANCQLLQRNVGGKIVSTVRVEQESGKTQGHFMNLVNDKIIDSQGHMWHGTKEIGSIGYFSKGAGEYVIVEIKDEFSDFGINSIKGLIEYTKRMHRIFCA